VKVKKATFKIEVAEENLYDVLEKIFRNFPSLEKA